MTTRWLGLLRLFLEYHVDSPGFTNVPIDEWRYLYSKMSMPKAVKLFPLQLPVICGVLSINHRVQH